MSIAFTDPAHLKLNVEEHARMRLDTLRLAFFLSLNVNNGNIP